METKTFNQRRSEFEKEVSDFFESSIKSLKKGESFEIADGDDEESVLESPFISRVGKHGDYNQYGIVSIEHTEEGKIVFHTRGTGEASDEKKSFEWGDMGYGEINDENLCDVCDILMQSKEFSNDEILEWFYSNDNERQNDLMNEADSDPADEKFHNYIREHFAEALAKYHKRQ